MEKIYDSIVIGAGPSGLTAALYLARYGLDTIIIEKAFPGGQMTLTASIENYPGSSKVISGIELANEMETQVKNAGVQIITDDVCDIYASEDKKYGFIIESVNKKVYKTLSIIIATGAKYKKLQTPGEDQFIGRGISYCATCDGPLYKNKNIAVVGGGDSAVEEAIFLTAFAKKLILIHRRDRLRAAQRIQDQLLSKGNVELMLGHKVKEFAGEKSINKIIVENVNSGKITSVLIDGVFIFVGFSPNTEFLKIKNIVKLNKDGHVITDGDMSTSAEGIFACGDVREKQLRQISTAVGDGALAAHSAKLFIDNLRGTVY